MGGNLSASDAESCTNTMVGRTHILLLSMEPYFYIVGEGQHRP